MSEVEELEVTEEHKKQLPKYVKKWEKVFVEPLNEDETLEAVRKLYATYDKPMPKVHFSENPQAAVDLAKKKYSREEVRSNIYVSTWWSSWAAWYEFLQEEVGAKFDKKHYEDFMQFVRNIQFSIAFEDDIYIAQKPKKIIIENDQFHASDEAAVQYNGGYNLYAFRGIKVDKDFIETPAEELSMDYYRKLSNADVRTCFIEKYGIERMLSEGKCVDTYENYLGTYLEENQPLVRSEYRLYDMSNIYDGDRNSMYLVFKHLTTGYDMAEGVKDMQTIPEALAYRTQSTVESLKYIKVEEAV